MVIPVEAKSVSIMGVDYAVLHIPSGGDLYLTNFGLSFRTHLHPENWYEPQWFVQRRIPLEGTSAIYKVPTKPVDGATLDLVARFNRVGQEVPLPSSVLNENPQAEFNSPFEEFALVMELRNSGSGGSGRVFTKRPLAIYAPSKRLQEWQTGRLTSKVAAKQTKHPQGILDMCREYIVLYGWIKGLNAVQVARSFLMSGSAAETFLKEATLLAIGDLQRRGFRVLDIKPEHVIMRMCHDGSLFRRRDGNPAYALVDYELLERIDVPSNNAVSDKRNDLCAV